MSETDPFYSEESDGMSKRTQLEDYFSQSLEVDLLLRLCPDDEGTIYQIVDLLVDTCAPSWAIGPYLGAWLGWATNRHTPHLNAHNSVGHKSDTLALPTVSLLCTPYAPWENKNQRIFVYKKCSAIQTTFLARKYGLQAADFRDDAVWGVIWLADKWATGPWDVTHLGFRCIASQFTIKYDIP